MRKGRFMQKLVLFAFAAFVSLSSSVQAQTQTADLFRSKDEAIEAYRNRYGLTNVYDKRVDNHGNGFEPLYGTRNFRAVLNGVVYRGGANNAYNRNGKRNNSNPLPNEGLQNLCEEGFNSAVYLYSTRYSSAPKAVRCTSRLGGENNLQYLQESPLNSESAALRILSLVYTKLTSATDHTPVYLHCWNGWHASGYVSALILRQFCGYSAEQAVAYWNRNTDGNDGSSYDSIRKRIRAFKPGTNMQIDAALQAQVCPQ